MPEFHYTMRGTITAPDGCTLNDTGSAIRLPDGSLLKIWETWELHPAGDGELVQIDTHDKLIGLGFDYDAELPEFEMEQETPDNSEWLAPCRRCNGAGGFGDKGVCGQCEGSGTNADPRHPDQPRDGWEGEKPPIEPHARAGISFEGFRLCKQDFDDLGDVHADLEGQSGYCYWGSYYIVRTDGDGWLLDLEGETHTCDNAAGLLDLEWELYLWVAEKGVFDQPSKADLVREYTAYCAAGNLPMMNAYEHDLSKLSLNERIWMIDFNRRWEIYVEGADPVGIMMLNGSITTGNEIAGGHLRMPN